MGFESIKVAFVLLTPYVLSLSPVTVFTMKLAVFVWFAVGIVAFACLFPNLYPVAHGEVWCERKKRLLISQGRPMPDCSNQLNDDMTSLEKWASSSLLTLIPLRIFGFCLRSTIGVGVATCVVLWFAVVWQFVYGSYTGEMPYVL